MKKPKIGLLPKIVIAIIAGIGFGYAAKFAGLPVLIRLAATYNAVFGQLLTFTIPLLIIGYITPSISELGQSAGKALGITVLISAIDNMIVALFAYMVTSHVFPRILSVGTLAADSAENTETSLASFLTIEIPPIMGVISALAFAFIFGIGIAKFKCDALHDFFVDFRKVVGMMIDSVIIPLLPVHVFGIFSNMTYAGTMIQVMGTFFKVVICIVLIHWTAILYQYITIGVLEKKNPFRLIRNMLPAYFTAIGTQSSAATMPVTTECMKKNEVRPSIAEFACPICANMHISGSSTTIVSCTVAILLLKGLDISAGRMIPFVLMLGVMLISAPAMPGGAVMAAIGILQSMLNFDDAMVSLIITLYIAQDSLGTACNVTGDGAVAMLIDRIMRKNAAAE